MWSLLYGTGFLPRWIDPFFDAPRSLINSLLHAFAPFAMALSAFLSSVVYVGFWIGLFGSLYLLLHRRQR